MNTSPLEAIRANLFKLTKKEQLIAKYILDDPQRVIQFNVDGIIKETHTSKSAFIRFSQKLGFDGYSEFRFAVSRELVGISETNTYDDFISMVSTSYVNFIHQLNSTVSVDEIQKLAKIIVGAKRIKIFANNRTALSAQHLRMRMAKIGVDAEIVDDLITMRDVSEYLGSQDLCIIYSIKLLDIHYGEIIKLLASHQCQIVAVTMTPTNAPNDLLTNVITLPYISRASSKMFLDDQPLFMIFNEILLNELAREI